MGDKRIRQRINADIHAMAQVVAQSAPDPDPHRTILSFNASTRISGLSQNAAFALLMGWSLRLQGVRVVNFVCRRGMALCVMGTDTQNINRTPPCRKCLEQSTPIYNGADLIWMEKNANPKIAENLKDKDLAALQAFQFDELPLGELCLPSMRWILRRHHLEEDEPTCQLYRLYIYSAYSVAKAFDQAVRDTTPQAVLVFNGMFFPEATARWVARRHGLPVYSHEVGLQPFSVFITDGDATAYPVDISDDFQLSPEQDRQLDDYLSKRFKGNFSMAGVKFWPEMTGLDDKLLNKIAHFRQVVPIFTNVIFDTSQPHANVVFTDMFAWLDEVLEVVKAHPDTLFVIRAHPDESRAGKASQESVAGWVRDRSAEAEQNLIFISPDDYFSSYEMIQRAKFVMIYNSTIGMEASIMGVPVLCAGKARFTQLETVFFPKSPSDYISTLEEFLAVEDVSVPGEHQVNARRFLYYQLYRTSLQFDQYLAPDGIWPGFVKLKSFSWQDLLPENSLTMKVISAGLLAGEEFSLPNG